MAGYGGMACPDAVPPEGPNVGSDRHQQADPQGSSELIAGAD